MSEPVKICVTGAAGQIGYALLFDIARGNMLGPDQKVILHLLDIPPMVDKLRGVEMELQDCAFPLLAGVVATADPSEGFAGVSYAILVGAMPRREGMQRSDLLKANCGIFKAQGAAIQAHARPDVKVLVVGNPANTNALICMTSAPRLPKTSFSALTRLDHNRSLGQIAAKAGVDVTDVHNVIIWGNHSKTQFPDISHGFIKSESGNKPIKDAVDGDWAKGEFVTTVQQRGATVIGLRGLSSAASAAKAIVDHMRDWALGTPEGEIVSMGVASDGSYGIDEGVIYSFPVTCKDGSYSIVPGLEIDEFSRKMMDVTAAELFEEKEAALSFLSS